MFTRKSLGSPKSLKICNLLSFVRINCYLCVVGHIGMIKGLMKYARSVVCLFWPPAIHIHAGPIPQMHRSQTCALLTMPFVLLAAATFILTCISNAEQAADDQRLGSEKGPSDWSSLLQGSLGNELELQEQRESHVRQFFDGVGLSDKHVTDVSVSEPGTVGLF